MLKRTGHNFPFLEKDRGLLGMILSSFRPLCKLSENHIVIGPTELNYGLSMLGPLHFESSRIGFVTRVTHQCLHEPHPLDTESLDGLEHIHHLLSLHPLQHSVQGAECTTAPKTVTRGEKE